MNLVCDIETCKGDYWIERSAQISQFGEVGSSTHAIFDVHWKHHFRVFDSIYHETALEFLNTQVQFVMKMVGEHIDNIKNTVTRILSGGRTNGPFVVKMFNKDQKVEALRAKCSFSENHLSCSCPGGFKGNELNCFRKNECLAEDECSENEVCLNLSGKYFCRTKPNPTCPDGYIGKFPDCEDFNECAADSKICPAGMVCENNKGNFTCNCADGSQG